MVIRSLLFFSLINTIITTLGGLFAAQYTYVDAKGNLFSTQVSKIIPTSLESINVSMLTFWIIIGLLFGTWSWFVFNKLVTGLIVRYGGPERVPDQAIHYTNTRHISMVTFTSAAIWLIIGLAAILFLKAPEGYTKYYSWVIIGGYLITGGLCSFLAHKLLMKIGAIVGF